MKFPKLSPRGYDLILDTVLGDLPQGYTFTRDDSGARVRYVVAYEGETLLQYTVGEDATGGGLHFGERSLIAERLIDPRNKTPEERRLLSKAGEVMRRIEEKLRAYTEIILPALVGLKVKDALLAGGFCEVVFKGTPYDFGGAVSDFVEEYYSGDAWTGCTFTLQQAEIDPDMPNASVEIECPADGGGLPAFVWVTARRLPGGKSKLVIETEPYDYDRSSQVQATLAGFLEALAGGGRIGTPGDVVTPETGKAASSPTIQAPVRAEKVLELELAAMENDKRYHARQMARVLLQYTEDPALRARLEAILEMPVSMTERAISFFQDPFRRVRPHIEATPEAEKTVSPGDVVSIEGQEKTGKRKPRDESKRKAAMVKRVIALWDPSKTAACSIVGIKPSTYNETLDGEYQEFIQKEIEILIENGFDDYLKAIVTKRGTLKDLYNAFWGGLK